MDKWTNRKSDVVTMLVGQANEIRIHFYCLLRSTKKAPIWLKRDKVCVIGNLANAVPLFYTTLYCPTLILLHLDFTSPLTLPHLLLYPTLFYPTLFDQRVCLRQGMVTTCAILPLTKLPRIVGPALT